MHDMQSIRTTSVLLTVLFSVPVGLVFAFLLIDAIGGLAIVGSLILFQWPLMAWFRRRGMLPAAKSTLQDNERMQ
jgi:hypothetical protein